jgi:hypothetical protein
MFFSMQFEDFKKVNNDKVSGFTMLDTPVPIKTLKLSNIGFEKYLDWRPSREFQVLMDPPPSFLLDSLCLNQVNNNKK